MTSFLVNLHNVEERVGGGAAQRTAAQAEGQTLLLEVNEASAAPYDLQTGRAPGFIEPGAGFPLLSQAALRSHVLESMLARVRSSGPQPFVRAFAGARLRTAWCPRMCPLCRGITDRRLAGRP